MTKKLLAFLFFLLLLGSVGSAYFFRDGVISLFSRGNSSWLTQGTIGQNDPAKKIDSDKVRSKIEQLREKYALRWLIYEGDAYLQNDQYGLALKQFTDALSQHPGNGVILEKVADTYFEMNKYDSAHTYYKKIVDSSDSIKDKIFLSLLYADKYTIKTSLNTLEKEVKDLSLGDERTFYYSTILWCSTDFHGCKKKFQDYFSQKQGRISFEPLKDMRDTFTNYDNFKLEDVYYKDSLLVGSLFKHKFYPLVVELGLTLNKEKPEYRPVIEMIAESFYGMGEYKPAKIWLETYIKLEPADSKAWYMMGVINLKLGEFVLSNIQFTKADGLWYTPKIQVERYLAYNYYILQQQDRLLAELASIITNQSDFTKEDLYLALYYHLINNQIDTATTLIEIGNKKFPDDVNMYWYYGWIFKEKWDLDSAIQYLATGLNQDPGNAFLLLNLWLTYKEKWDTAKEKVYLNKVLKEAPNSEFANQSKTELDSMNLMEKVGK